MCIHRSACCVLYWFAFASIIFNWITSHKIRKFHIVTWFLLKIWQHRIYFFQGRNLLEVKHDGLQQAHISLSLMSTITVFLILNPLRTHVYVYIAYPFKSESTICDSYVSRDVINAQRLSHYKPQFLVNVHLHSLLSIKIGLLLNSGLPPDKISN